MGGLLSKKSSPTALLSPRSSALHEIASTTCLGHCCLEKCCFTDDKILSPRGSSKKKLKITGFEWPKQTDSVAVLREKNTLTLESVEPTARTLSDVIEEWTAALKHSCALLDIPLDVASVILSMLVLKKDLEPPTEGIVSRTCFGRMQLLSASLPVCDKWLAHNGLAMGHQLKATVFGMHSTGKTCLCQSWAKSKAVTDDCHKQDDDWLTNAVNTSSYRKVVQLNWFGMDSRHSLCVVEALDMFSGIDDEDLRMHEYEVFYAMEAAVITFSVANQKSFEFITENVLHKMVRFYDLDSVKDCAKLPLVLVAMDSDRSERSRVVDESDVFALCRKFDMPLIRSELKSYDNVDLVFETAMKERWYKSCLYKDHEFYN